MELKANVKQFIEKHGYPETAMPNINNEFKSELKDLLQEGMSDAWLQSIKKFNRPLTEKGFTGWLNDLKLFDDE